jgi:hypothetical protein
MQLESLNVDVGILIPTDALIYEKYDLEFQAGGGARLWWDAGRTSEIIQGQPYSLDGPDVHKQIYVEALDAGSVAVTAKLVANDPFVQQTYGDKEKTFTTQFEWLNGSLNTIEQKVEEGAKNLAKSKTESELGSHIFDPLRQSIKDERDNLNRDDPNYRTQYDNCNNALQALDGYNKSAANAIGEIAFDVIQFSFNALLPTTQPEKHPTNDVFKSTIGNSNPGIEYSSIKPVFEWKSIDYDDLLSAVLAGNLKKIEEWSVNPTNYIKSIGLGADVHFGPDIKGTVAFGISNFADTKNLIKNTYYLKTTYNGHVRNIDVAGSLEFGYTPETRVFNVTPVFTWIH